MKQLIIFSLLLLLGSGRISAQIPVPPSPERYMDAAPPAPVQPKSGLFKEGSLYGIRQTDGGLLIPALYDTISLKNGFYLSTRQKRQGLYNTEGQLLLKPDYDSISIRSSFVIAYQGKQMALYYLIRGARTNPAESKLLGTQKLQQVVYADHRIVILQRAAAQKTIINSEGRIIIPDPKKELIFLHNSPLVADQGRYAFLPEQAGGSMTYYDEILTNAGTGVHKNVQLLSDHIKAAKVTQPYYIVRNGTHFGLVDFRGEEVLPPMYDKINPNSGAKGYFFFLHNLVGFYHNHQTLPAAYQALRLLDDQYILALKDGVYSLIKADSLQPLPIQSQSVIRISQKQQFICQQNNKSGLVNAAGTVLIPFEYDEIKPKNDWGEELPPHQYIVIRKTGNEEQYGVYDLRQHKLIIPVAHEYIGITDKSFVWAVKNKKIIYYNLDGSVRLDVQADYVEKSPLKGSDIEVLYTINDPKNPQKDEVYLTDKTGHLLLQDLSAYELIYDTKGLYNPVGQHMVALRHRNGQYALYDELEHQLRSGFEYDTIRQGFSYGNQSVYVVQKHQKWGLIDAQNKVIIPFEYDDLNMNLQPYEAHEGLTLVAARKHRYGVINRNNEVLIPFQYAALERISSGNLFKARKKDHYQLINLQQKVLNSGPFDEISYFESAYVLMGQPEQANDFLTDQPAPQMALAFRKDTVRLINQEGQTSATDVQFAPHEGYTTFEALKTALVQALDSDDPEMLRSFCRKIAPSPHLLYLLHRAYPDKGIFMGAPGKTEAIAKAYYQYLTQFKVNSWNSGHYNQNSLRRVKDFTLFTDNTVTVKRNRDHAYGDTRIMEKVLRHCFKINGFWISGFFTNSRFIDVR